MPVIDGAAFCDALDTTLSRHGAAVVAMTAVHRVAEFRNSCHADDLLGKPFDSDDLYTVIGRHLGPR